MKTAARKLITLLPYPYDTFSGAILAHPGEDAIMANAGNCGIIPWSGPNLI